MFRRRNDRRAERARRNERRVEQLRQVRRQIRERAAAARATERVSMDSTDRAPRLERLREEARYRRDRLALYKARLYRGRPLDESKLRELQRSADGAAARVDEAEERSSRPRRRA